MPVKMPRPKRTISDKQLAANRANAARSTGPRSPEGKARSAQNARRHGFTASTFGVVRLEDLDEIARLADDLVAACLDESLDRTDTPVLRMHPELTEGVEVTRQQNRNYLLALGFHRQVARNSTWTHFFRYQAQAERLYRRAVEDLERLIRLRGQLPNEPISPALPEPDQLDTAPPDKPVSA